MLLRELDRSGAVPLERERRTSLEKPSVAAVIPSFRRGSGGHTTIMHLLSSLASAGHDVSVWLEDHEGRHAHEGPERTRSAFAAYFPCGELALHTDYAAWQGADIVLATGWQTVPRVLLLARASARAYLVQDHEPDFYPASAESLWAAWTYRQGLHCVAASAWLAELLRERYGASATHFDLAVDHGIYHPADRRREEQVAFYARAATPRRAVPLGLAALDELAGRRPELEIVLYGEASLETGRAFRNLGVLAPHGLAELYRTATVGLVLSLTNPSLVGLEMMACGAPCVELASEPMIATFGRDGPLRLADPDPAAICTAIEELLDSPALRAEASRAGIDAMTGRTWSRAASQVADGLQAALAAARN